MLIKNNTYSIKSPIDIQNSKFIPLTLNIIAINDATKKQHIIFNIIFDIIILPPL